MDWEKLELSPKIINALKKGTHVPRLWNTLTLFDAFNEQIRIFEFIHLCESSQPT